ncbi:MAG: hypothetical protein AAFU41_00900 [Pseudomonadota bacterium]
MADWSTFSIGANWQSPNGNVRDQDVTITYSDDAVDAVTPGSEGQEFTFAFSVTDEISSIPLAVGPFTVTIEYDARIASFSGNQGTLDINDIVAADEIIDWEITGGTPYDGIYSDTRQNVEVPIYHHDGTQSITPFEMAVEGNTYTCDPGVLLVDTADPVTYSFQWSMGGAVVSGATSANYTAQAADAGLTPSCEVTASDGTATIVVVASGPSAFSVTRHLTPVLVNPSNTTTADFSIDMTSVPTGSTVVLSVASRDGSNLQNQVSVTVDGTLMQKAELPADVTGTGRCEAGHYYLENWQGGAGAFQLTSEQTPDLVAAQAYYVEGFAASGGAFSVSATSDTSLEGILSAQADDVAFACAIEDRGTGSAVIDGFTDTTTITELETGSNVSVVFGMRTEAAAASVTYTGGTSAGTSGQNSLAVMLARG